MLSLQLSLFIQLTLGTWKSPGECDESAIPSKLSVEGESDYISSRCFSGLKIQLLPVKGELIKDRLGEQRGKSYRGGGLRGQMCVCWRRVFMDSVSCSNLTPMRYIRLSERLICHYQCRESLGGQHGLGDRSIDFLKASNYHLVLLDWRSISHKKWMEKYLSQSKKNPWQSCWNTDVFDMTKQKYKPNGTKLLNLCHGWP